MWLFFKHPGWRPEQPVPSVHEVRGRAQFDADTTRPRKIYLFVQFVVSLVATVVLLFGKNSLPYSAQFAVGMWILASSAAVGVGFESARKSNFVTLEIVRLLALPALVAYLMFPRVAWGGEMLTALAITGAFALLSLTALRLTRR